MCRGSSPAMIWYFMGSVSGAVKQAKRRDLQAMLSDDSARRDGDMKEVTGVRAHRQQIE